MKKFIHCTTALLLFTITVHAAVKLPRLLSNGMVLQRDQNLKIWGWADVGEKVTLTFKNKKYTAKTGSDRKWNIRMEPQQAGGPFHMRINNIELKDLLIGDVWLCSGQSNMEATMDRPNIKANYPQIIEQSNYPMIRQFTVKRDMAFNPTPDVSSDKGWVSASPTTVLSFSAVAYFFAKDLYEKYKVPIGIINSSVGGTPAQSWINSESLKPFPEYEQLAQKLKDTAEVTRILKAHQIQSAAWDKSMKDGDLGINEKWFLTAYNEATSWQEIASLTQLSEKLKTPKYGSMWFKTEVNIPQHLAGKAASISLGVMQTQDEAYLNGEKIGSINSGYALRNYPIKAGLLKAGKNDITIRLMSPTNPIAFNSKNNYQLKFENDSISITAPWKFKFGVETAYLARGNGLSIHSPTAYYYPMIQPLSNYAIKGVTWYQGESNVPKPEQYQALLTSLINLWRKDWQQPNLPFLFVQLANYSATGIEPPQSNWALLREAQMKTLNVPHTAMAVIHDVGEKNDLHPRNKSDVGKRLAVAAEHVAYHKNTVYSGPIYKSAKITGNQVYVSFDHTGTGLKCLGDKLNMFTISADGKEFIAAQAKIVGKQVVVWNDTITKPIAVRYAWADSPDGANLYNQEGLPASSFKSN